MLVMAPQSGQRLIGERGIGQHKGEYREQKLLQQPMRVVGRQDTKKIRTKVRRGVFVRFGLIGGGQRYLLVSRQPAASASSTEQNQRVPLLILISILAYQRLVGL